MTLTDRERIMRRILSGCVKCTITSQIGQSLSLFIKPPNKYQLHIAEEIYHEYLTLAELEGSYTEGQLMAFLFKKGLWSKDKQAVFDKLPKDIEELKVGLFRSTFNSEQKIKIRRALQLAKQELENLFDELHEYDYLGAKGVANMAKARYLLACSLHKTNGSPLIEEEYLSTLPDYIIESVAAELSKYKVSEQQYREIARTEPWRNTWMCKKACPSVFGVPAIELTDEQRVLCIWSVVYDNVLEHPESPSEEVVNDDDALDGWMILEKRKRALQQQGNEVDAMITNEKIKNSEEVFIPVGSYEDAKKVMAQNDNVANSILRQRMALAKSKGVVSETEMPDSQMKIRQQMTQMYVEHAQGKG